MESITLARPYARAAFELAREQGTLAAWWQALSFAATVAQDARIADLRSDPRVDPSHLAKLHMPPDVTADTPVANFLDELAERSRIGLLPEVFTLFDALKRESESTLKVKVTSAQALDADQIETLKASLKRRFQRDIVIDAKVDTALLAGVVIDTGSQVIDGSARGRLERLASALTH